MKKDKFEEIKIKMVMKLKRLSSSSAIKEIAEGNARHTAPKINREDDVDRLMTAHDIYSRLDQNNETVWLNSSKFRRRSFSTSSLASLGAW